MPTDWLHKREMSIWKLRLFSSHFQYHSILSLRLSAKNYYTLFPIQIHYKSTYVSGFIVALFQVELKFTFSKMKRIEFSHTVSLLWWQFGRQNRSFFTIIYAAYISLFALNFCRIMTIIRIECHSWRSFSINLNI